MTLRGSPGANNRRCESPLTLEPPVCLGAPFAQEAGLRYLLRPCAERSETGAQSLRPPILRLCQRGAPTLRNASPVVECL